MLFLIRRQLVSSRANREKKTTVLRTRTKEGELKGRKHKHNLSTKRRDRTQVGFHRLRPKIFKSSQRILLTTFAFQRRQQRQRHHEADIGGRPPVRSGQGQARRPRGCRSSPVHLPKLWLPVRLVHLDLKGSAPWKLCQVTSGLAGQRLCFLIIPGFSSRHYYQSFSLIQYQYWYWFVKKSPRCAV